MIKGRRRSGQEFNPAASVTLPTLSDEPQTSWFIVALQQILLKMIEDLNGFWTH